MSMTLEALYFVGMVTLEPHRVGTMIMDHAGTDREPIILGYLKEYQTALRDFHGRKIVTDIIEAFEAR